MNKLIFLLLVFVILLCSPTIAEEYSFIIVNALNPEGIEIGTIQDIDYELIEIYDEEIFLDYGANDEQTANMPVPISPGQHTIKVVFNGMPLEQNINLVAGETKRLLFTFPRIVFDLSTEIASDFNGGCTATVSYSFSLNPGGYYEDNNECYHIIRPYAWGRALAEAQPLVGSYSASVSFNLGGNSFSAQASASAVVTSGDGTAWAGTSFGSLTDIPGWDGAVATSIPSSNYFDEWFVQYIREGDYPTFGVEDQNGSTATIIVGGEKGDGFEGYGYWTFPASKIYQNFLINPQHPYISLISYPNPSSESITLSGQLTNLKMSSVPYDILGTGVQILHQKQGLEKSCSGIYNYVDDAIKYLPTQSKTTSNHFVTDYNSLLTRDLIKAVILHESQYHQFCYDGYIGKTCKEGEVLKSRTGYRGLMQLGGGASKDINNWLHTAFSMDKPDENVKLGVAHLNFLLNAYFSKQAPMGGYNEENGNIPFAVAAYNCGQGKIVNATKKYCLDKGIQRIDCTWNHIKSHLSEFCENIDTKTGVADATPYVDRILKSLEEAKKQNNYDYCLIGRKNDKIIQRVRCPVNLTIVDQYNRTINNITNEIPDAFFEQDGDEKTAYLPTNLSYTTLVQAYDSGNFTLTTMFWPDSNSTGLTSFENIQVNPNTQVKQIIQLGIPNNKTLVDQDGNGVFEKNLTGNLSILYPTQIDIIGNLSAISFGSVNLIASLSQYNGKPISNKTIIFTLGGQTAEGITNKDGTVNVTVTVMQEPGQYLLYAEFKSNSTYISSFAMSPFDILNMSFISLKSGWNLVSVPLELVNNSVGNVFKGLNATIYGYNGSWFVPYTIINNSAYWVKVNNNITFFVEGSAIENKTIGMQKGWNLIGYLFQTNDIMSALSIIEDCYEHVYYWDGIWRSFSSLRPFSQNTLQNMTFGRSYWILVNCSQINWTY